MFCEVMFFVIFCRSNFLAGKMAVNSHILALFWRVDFTASFTFVCLCEKAVIVSITSVLLSVSSGTHFNCVESE